MHRVCNLCSKLTYFQYWQRVIVAYAHLHLHHLTSMRSFRTEVKWVEKEDVVDTMVQVVKVSDRSIVSIL